MHDSSEVSHASTLICTSVQRLNPASTSPAEGGLCRGAGEGGRRTECGHFGVGEGGLVGGRIGHRRGWENSW